MPSPAFILSTGRTGTQFFESYLNESSPAILCLHEPRPSRRFKFLSNLYLSKRIKAKLVARIYRRSRRGLFARLGERQYLESSNFMFGCIPALNPHYPGIRVLHIVRHPVSYTRSHLGHGFWRGHKRFFARYVPYWIERTGTPRSAGPLALLAARWNYVNRQIASYEDTNPYLRIRFEDLFSKDRSKASGVLNQIRAFLDLAPLSEAENLFWLEKQRNPSRKRISLSPAEEEAILSATAKERLRFGYSDKASNQA